MDRGSPHADRSLWFSCLHTQGKALCYRFVVYFIVPWTQPLNTATSVMNSAEEFPLTVKSYVTGGWHASTENTDKVECYNPKTNQWTMCAPMKERRYRPGAAVVDGKIYVLGGEEGWDR